MSLRRIENLGLGLSLGLGSLLFDMSVCFTKLRYSSSRRVCNLHYEPDVPLDWNRSLDRSTGLFCRGILLSKKKFVFVMKTILLFRHNPNSEIKPLLKLMNKNVPRERNNILRAKARPSSFLTCFYTRKPRGIFLFMNL